VHAGTTVRFRAWLSNRSIRPADYDQSFRIELRLIGDGSVLTRTTVRVIVPRRDSAASDAGAPSDGPGP
jgi:hypothetical protein